MKIAQSSINDLIEKSVTIYDTTSEPIKPINELFSKIKSSADFILSERYDVKDVGFNYWSKGKGKQRNAVSIGDRVLYSGQKQNPLDIPYIKGRDIDKYYKDIPTNYLRNNYKEYLEEGIDTFRFSSDVMENTEKIIYRQTANRIIATIDEDKLYNDKTIHCIIPKENGISKLYLLALLNSKLFEFLYRELSQENEGRAFSQVKTVYIKQLPIIIASNKEIETIEEIVKKMLDKRKNNREADISDEETELNKLIYKIYGLEQDDIKKIENV